MGTDRPGPMGELPVIDVGPLLDGRGEVGAVASAIDAACRRFGFFYLTGHGVDPSLPTRLEGLARLFFAQSDEEKSEVAMERAGPAWRGWFPLGAELTGGVPDRKEGLYFGTELVRDDPRVLARRPLMKPTMR